MSHFITMQCAWFLLALLIHQSCSEKILIYIPLPFYSHQAVYRPLWKELVNRGHQITLLTPNLMESQENITQVDLSPVYTFLEEKQFHNILTSGDQSVANILKFYDLLVEATNFELSIAEMKSFIDGEGTFDLVITEFMMPIGVAMAYRYKCPVIGVVPMDLSIDHHSALGNPTHPVLYPVVDLPFFGQLSIKERLFSTIYYFTWLSFVSYLYKRADSVAKMHFGDLPSLRQLEEDASLVFINTNPIFYTARPLSPQTINVGGGLHIDDAKPLPEDIQTFLDNSPEGVVYFSLGSSIQSNKLSFDKKKVIIDAFSQLPYKVLWKYELPWNDSSLPGNVHTWKWLPQQDVLRHPNIKLFITQGGLLSLEEALFIGVPVLVLPFFGDQISNAIRVVEYGFGLSLDHKALNVSSFKNSIMEVATTNRYKHRIMELARKLNDTPMKGVEKAAWWIEYLLRNKNVDILKTPHNVPLYQYYFLDVVVIFLGLLVALYFIICIHFTLLSYCIKRLFGIGSKLKKE